MNGRTVKQLLRIGDKPILYYALQQFEVCPGVSEIILVTREEDLALVADDVVTRYGFRKINKIVAGGKERQDSVYRGLEAIESRPDLVIIHDGVRPLVQAAFIENVMHAAETHGAAVLGVPLTSTIKRVQKGFAVDTVDRDELWEIQTPQAFNFDLIVAAHEKARSEGFQATDDAVLVERMGRPIAVLPGDKRNLKVTTADDLMLASRLIEDF